MTFAELLLAIPLLLAVSVVVGAAGHDRGEIVPSIRRAFVGLLIAVIVIGILVRLIVELFA